MTATIHSTPPANEFARNPPSPTPPGVDAAAPVNDPDVLANYHYWRDYDWAQRGEEWSAGWGGTDNLWYGTVLPRIQRFLPARPDGHILEIGCGFGRMTEYLRRHAPRVTALELTPHCVEAARDRFGADARVRVVLNDGMSLDALENDSVDLAFSWDSLVNTEQNVVSAYLAQLAVKLRPGGAALLHCGNLGAYVERLNGQEPAAVTAGRRASQTAARFRDDCRALGLRCISQELIPWGSTVMLTDHLSLLARTPESAGRPPMVVERHDWRQEVAGVARVGAMYRL